MRITADQTIENRRAFVKYVTDHPGSTFDQICAGIGLRQSTANHIRTMLSAHGIIESRVIGQAWQRGWYLGDGVAKKPAKGPAEAGVTIEPDTRWVMPAVEVTMLPSGVKITRQAAPKGRFEVELKPGSGVISYDNWRLTQATARGAQA
jgi:hypothetical protein